MSEAERSYPMPPRRVLLSRVALAVALAGVLGLAIWIVASRITVQDTQPPRPALGGGGVLRVHDAPLEVPNLEFEDGAGQRRSLAQFRGRHVLLNVWATWCAPCREEMPALARLQQKLGGPDFELLALSIDPGGAEAVKRFYGEIGVDGLAIYVDRSMQASSALRAVGIPTTVLLDRDGREIARHLGPAQWDSAQTVQSIQRLISGARRE